MAAINSVYTATATEAALDDEVLNPDRTAHKGKIDIQLVLDGVTVDAGEIYDMVNAAFGTVTTDKVPSRSTYIFRISA